MNPVCRAIQAALQRPEDVRSQFLRNIAIGIGNGRYQSTDIAGILRSQDISEDVWQMTIRMLTMASGLKQFVAFVLVNSSWFLETISSASEAQGLEERRVALRQLHNHWQICLSG